MCLSVADRQREANGHHEDRNGQLLRGVQGQENDHAGHVHQKNVCLGCPDVRNGLCVRDLLQPLWGRFFTAVSASRHRFHQWLCRCLGQHDWKTSTNIPPPSRSDCCKILATERSCCDGPSGCHPGLGQQCVVLLFNAGLVWFRNSNLLVLSDKKINKFDASTRKMVLEWPVPDTDCFSCIALPTCGEFITCSSHHTVMLWDSSTHTQFPLIRHPRKISFIAPSPTGQFLIIGCEGGKIAVKIFPSIVVSIVLDQPSGFTRLSNSHSIPPFRNLTFISTTLCLIYGNMINSETSRPC